MGERVAAHGVDAAGPSFAQERTSRVVGQLGPVDDLGRSERLEIAGVVEPSGAGHDMMAPSSRPQDRRTADAAGGAGDQQRVVGRGVESVRLERQKACIAVKPAVPMAMACRVEISAGSGTSQSASTRARSAKPPQWTSPTRHPVKHHPIARLIAVVVGRRHGSGQIDAGDMWG